ncbi:amidohydrolase family protein [Propionivibrio dicarboxylicus]|uniref:Predicted metal-dependent hydrolase, TIM-barrel fold n=1 Tax=Propionivibrio dicarboxylicus TaxID=83767 RepID=A0A1G7Z409_9RHOO|nr:amidohydrolase family protein [Propionivibrio dicarboxylicus]SDH03458.1 Predicted metal-dependent hydrolase, TIM-barrel fold [Propionivibrio dicarboxylicus]
MTAFSINRREALQKLGILSIGAGAIASGAGTTSAQILPISWSTGVDRPRTKVPANACDCHHHIYDARYPFAPEATLRPGDALIADYRRLQERLGTSRNVIVQPSSYGVDNRLLVESLKQFGGNARGIAVVNTSVSDAQLRELHEAGVRGIRFNLAPPGTTTLDMVKPLAMRIAPMGWHVQVNAPANYLLEARDIWSSLPCPVVFDHLGRVPQPNALRHPTFAMVRELLQQGRAYVKLSGFYNETKVGGPSYSDSVEVAKAYAIEAPERVVWGSDWPHPTEHTKVIPDDAILLDALSLAVSSKSALHKVLVENPATLYQFS